MASMPLFQINPRQLMRDKLYQMTEGGKVSSYSVELLKDDNQVSIIGIIDDVSAYRHHINKRSKLKWK